MTTKMFKEKISDTTYSIRIGRKPPEDSVNLAFVDVQKSEPQYNITISDYSDDIIGNPTEEQYNDYYALIDGDYNVIFNGKTLELPNDDILIADEFSLVASILDNPKPLYYRYMLERKISLNIPGIFKYSSGYTKQTISSLMSEQIKEDDTKFIYIGDKIKLLDDNNNTINVAYKIVLVKTEENTASVYIYLEKPVQCNVIYDSTNGIITERIKPMPYFIRDDETVNSMIAEKQQNNSYKTDLNLKIYSLIQNGDKYYIKIPSETLVADINSRPMEVFRFRIDNHKIVRYSKFNTGVIKFGVITNFSNETKKDRILNAIHSMFKSTLTPTFIEYTNPHPIDVNKNNSRYWLCDINMPIDYYKDYDVLLLTGDSVIYIDEYQDVLEEYLASGGSLIIDNYGNYNETLLLSDTQSFLGINFDPLTINTTKKVLTDSNDIFTRLYDLSNYIQMPIGYGDVGPKILTDAEWNILLTHYGNDEQALIYKNFYNRGLVFVSNCGIVRGIANGFNSELNTKLLLNMITVCGEDVWLITPWITESLIHKNNLFTNEYNELSGYRLITNPENKNETVAAKVYATKVKDVISTFYNVNYFALVDEYYIRIEQNINNQFVESVNIKHKPIYNDEDSLMFWTDKYVPSSFDLSDTDFQHYDIDIYPYTIQAIFTVFSGVYEYDNITGQYNKKYGQYFNSKQFSINSLEGYKMIAKLADVIPPLPAGIEWAKRYNVFYEASLSYFDELGRQKFMNVPVSIFLYNSKTKEFYIDSDGKPSIFYSDIFETGDDTINYIYVIAKTSFNTVAAIKRRANIRCISARPLQISLTEEIDNDVEWGLRITNFKFNIDTTNSGYKITNTYKPYQFDRQLFEPYMPLKKIEKETPIFINNNKIKLNRKNIYWRNGQSINEELIMVSQNKYKSDTQLLWEPDDIIIKVDGIVIDESHYNVDYDKGIVNFVDIQISENATVTATYKYRTVNVYKIKYDNEIIEKELANKIDNNTFKLNHNNIYNLKLYSKDGLQYNQISSAIYDYDMETGIINFKRFTPANVYADYKYFERINLKIKDVDTVSGILYLQDSVSIQDSVEVSYYYSETQFDYHGYNDGKRFVKFDLNPLPGHTISIEKVLETGMIALDENGDVIYEDIPVSDILNKPIYLYMLPYSNSLRYIAKVAKGIVTNNNGTLTVSNGNTFYPNNAIIHNIKNQNHIPRHKISGIAFVNTINKETAIRDYNIAIGDGNSIQLQSDIAISPIEILQSDKDYDYIAVSIINKYNIRHTLSKKYLDKLMECDKSVMLIAEIVLRSHTSLDDIVIIDARQRGGGLKEEYKLEDLALIDPNVLNFWDIGDFDGIPYEKNGVLIIKVPKKVLEYFSPDEVNKIANRHVSYGIKYMIEYV